MSHASSLDPAVWPRSAALDPDGVLRIGGLRVDELAAEYGTPLLVLDEADFRSRCADFRTAFGSGATVCYAGKAFLSKAIARWVQEEGLSLDVCTGGELAVAEAVEFPAERITFHGNNKSVAELRRAVAYGVGPDRRRLERGDRAARRPSPREAGRAPAGLHPGDARRRGPHPRVRRDRAGGPEVRLLAVVGRRRGRRRAGARAIPSSNWSACTPTSARRSSTPPASGWLRSGSSACSATIRDAHGIELPELDLGGGFGIAYTSEDAPLDIAEMADRMKALVEKACADAGLRRSASRASSPAGRSPARAP